MTENEILTTIYHVILASPIADLSGGVFKKVRPTDSQLEDCVISIIPGNVGKFLRDGGLYVKLFFKDIFNNNTHWEDSVNAQTKETLLFNLSESLFKLNGMSFYKESRELMIESLPESHEHFAVLKINFKQTLD